MKPSILFLQYEILQYENLFHEILQYEIYFQNTSVYSVVKWPFAENLQPFL